MLKGLGGVVGNQVFRRIGSAVSARRLLILYYHRVHNQYDPMRNEDVDAANFDWQMQLLSENFTVLPLSEAIARLYTNDLPPATIAVTFDDGYADNVDVALPILKRWNIPATFFLTTGYFGDGRMWNDTIIEAVRLANSPSLNLSQLALGEYPITTMEQRCKAADAIIKKLKHLPRQERDVQVGNVLDNLQIEVKERPMMTKEQVKQLCDSNMEIGGHTVNHPILSRVAFDEACDEIVTGKNNLEKIIGREVRLFAYPNGVPHRDYERQHVDFLSKAGFDAAVSTAWGAASYDGDKYQLPRIAPWDKTPLRFYARLVRSYRNINFDSV